MESVFKAALAEAVLADQFQQTCQTGLDRKHLQEMSLEKVKAKDIKKTTTKYLAGN